MPTNTGSSQLGRACIGVQGATATLAVTATPAADGAGNEVFRRPTPPARRRLRDIRIVSLSGRHVQPRPPVLRRVLGLAAEVRDRSRREQRIAEVFPRGVRDSEVRRLLKGELYEYQCEGALFAARAGRCLIAGEMGLGKTIQALAATEIMARLFGVERVLLVCPTSLKHQWQREIERFTERSVEVVN